MTRRAGGVISNITWDRPSPLPDPVFYDAAALLTPGYTNDDVHRRREGEPLGDVPEVGDVVRHALRHGSWDVNWERVDGWPARDAQGPWSEPHRVLAVMAGEQGEARFTLQPIAGGSWCYIDLSWWIVEAVVADGRLW